MQIFYITFCWNRRLLYDGYIIREDNNKILGCTDEEVITGNDNGFKEVLNDGMVMFYPISKEIFLQYETLDGFRVGARIKEQEVKISFKRVQNVCKEAVIARIKNVLRYYPEEIREVLEESCLGEE